jgi:hypothetical protein
MAFLDNSGDIILDCVLTDTGRYRLAKGDGSFKIAKFALGDDEIDYSLYDKDNASGSAYYDLNILQTPVLEALTDNSSALKSRLLTISQTDLLFLPVIKLFEGAAGNGSFNDQKYFAVAADANTELDFKFSGPNFKTPEGMFFTSDKQPTSNNNIVLDQGLDTPKISPTQNLDADLIETSYMVEMDNRLGSLYDQALTELARSYIDDDQMATYLLSTQKNPTELTTIPTATATGTGTTSGLSSIRGPRGTRLNLKLAASLELQTSTYLFEELGFVSGSYNVIDTNLRVTGATTGYRIDIPIRYIKKI